MKTLRDMLDDSAMQLQQLNEQREEENVQLALALSRLKSGDKVTVTYDWCIGFGKAIPTCSVSANLPIETIKTSAMNK